MSPPASPAPVDTIVYVDGFNLYYRVIKNSPYRWLDLARYFRLLRNRDNLLAVKYFTALVKGPGQGRQLVYWEALATTPLVRRVDGAFKEKKQLCKVTACTSTGARRFKIYEEKRTDVNIAVEMLDDAHRGACKRIILVSGDSDLVPSVRLAVGLGVEVIVYVPCHLPKLGQYAYELRGAASSNAMLPLNLLPHCLFPDPVVGPKGPIRKPAGW